MSSAPGCASSSAPVTLGGRRKNCASAWPGPRRGWRPWAANRIGEENDGWRLARTSLGHERTIGGTLARGAAGAASSISRLLITALEQDIHEIAVDLLGPAGLLGKSAPQAVQRSRWLVGFLRTRASTIGAATTDIQMNTVADQLLGLPHDPGMPPR